MAMAPRWCAVLAACLLLVGWSAPLASASVVALSDQQASVSPSPTEPSDSTSYSLVPSAFSLMVSPTRLTIGQANISKVSRILVVNRGQSPVVVTVLKRNFIGGPNGALTFQDNAPYAAADWVTLAPTGFALAPGATQVVTVAVAVPGVPEPGDHQVAVVFLVPTTASTANIRINRGIATPVYITVPGPLDDTALLSGLAGPGFVMSGTVSISTTVRDTGTVHRDFRGPTQLMLTAGGAATAFPDFTILRDSARDISTTWDPPLMCICHPKVTFANADGSIQTATMRVIVFPLYQLVIIIAALLLIAWSIRRWRRRHRANSANAVIPRNTPNSGDDA